MLELAMQDVYWLHCLMTLFIVDLSFTLNTAYYSYFSWTPADAYISYAMRSYCNFHYVLNPLTDLFSFTNVETTCVNLLNGCIIIILLFIIFTISCVTAIYLKQV